MYRLLFVLLLVLVPEAVGAQARSAVGVHLTVVEAAVTVQSPACAGCAGLVVTQPGAAPTVLLNWQDASGSPVRSRSTAPGLPVGVAAAAAGVAGAGRQAPAVDPQRAGEGGAVHVPGLFAQGAEPMTGTLTMTVIVH